MIVFLIQSQRALTLDEELFAAHLTERLQAVNRDRIAMEQKVRNDARQEGKLTFEEIIVSLLLDGCSVE